MFNKFKSQKQRNTSQRTQNRTDLFRTILAKEEIDLHNLESLCFEGIPEDNEIKAMCWKILLGYLPTKTTEWKSHLIQQRNLYEFYINLLFQNPDTYDNGQGPNKNHIKHTNNHHQSTQSMMQISHSLDLISSDKPVTNAPTATTTKTFKNAYFQDNDSSTNNKSQKHKIAFFEDSDDERGPKPGLFDSDDDDITIGDILKIDNTQKHNNKNGQNGQSLSTSDDILKIDETKKHKNDTHKSTQSQSTNDEILFMTPTSSKDSDSVPPNINDPILKDLETKTDETMSITAKSIFDDDANNANTNKHKHAKTDSKILVNGKDIKLVNPKSVKLEFKQSEIDDPLKNTPNNPWKTYFDDWEIWNRIKKDIHRTHQTYAFFRSNHMICQDSASKSYRFPFDITSSPPPITPSMSSTLTPNIIKPKHAQTSSPIVPILKIPENGLINAHAPNSPNHASVNSEDTFHSLSDNQNSDSSESELDLDALNVSSQQRKQSMADNEIISDIESIHENDVDIDDMSHPDLPPPAAQNMKIRTNVNAVSSSSPTLSSKMIDPNKKARIERYVMDSQHEGIHAQIMIRILCVYARLNKGVEYVQGMNELLAPIYYIFNMDPSENRKYAEADSFFCFMNLMSYLADRFIAESDNSQLGIIAVVNEFDELLERVDFELWNLLKTQMLDSKFYALRWLMLLMAMEFQLPEVLRLWDSFLSDHNRFEFVSYFALAMLQKVRPQLMSGNFASNLQLLQKYPSFDLYELLVPAIEIRNKYPPIIDEQERKRKKLERESLRKKHLKKIEKKKAKSYKKYNRNKSKSPRMVFKKDMFGNILRPQSSRLANGRNIFRSRSPTASSVKSPSFGSDSNRKGMNVNGNNNGRDRGHSSTQSFSFGSWKKKFAK